MRVHILRLLLTAALMLPAVPGAATAAPSATRGASSSAAEEQKIRALIRHWVAQVEAKNIPAIADMYAPDGLLMVPNAPAFQGKAGVAQAWTGMLGLPGFALSFGPTEIQVADSGDMALDRGTYVLKTTGANGPIEDRGKYLVVWRKIGGEWKVAADMLNSDLPAR